MLDTGRDSVDMVQDELATNLPDVMGNMLHWLWRDMEMENARNKALDAIVFKQLD